MCERDYEGSMEPFQQILLKKGITKAMLDMEQFRGCTYSELKRIAEGAYVKKKESK